MLKFYKTNSSKIFQFLALVILSLLCLLLDTLTQINFRKIELPKDRPEYNATGIDGKVFSKQGKLLYRLISESGLDYPNDNRIFLSNLDLYMYQESSDVVKYELQSNNGWLDHITKLGFLGANTHVTVFDSNPKKNINIYGSNIDLDLNRNFFTSKNDVRAIQDKSIITGMGFSYDQAKQFLVLNSKVHVLYESE